jgi:N-acetylglucosaminyldiphosphoundecaprenol N-acetyl-beta-D-mannosaminyltransferase
MKEIIAFGVRINPVTISEFVEIIEAGIKNNKQIIQSGVNASSIVELEQNRDLLEAYNNCDLINIDGMSLVWALRFFGYKVPSRVACPDLAEKVLRLAELNNYRIFLIIYVTIIQTLRFPDFMMAFLRR